MIPLALLLAAAPLADTSRADAVEIVFPGAIRVRIVVRVAGQPPDVGWSRFLDAWFDHFDRDGGGSLSRLEATRLFPLPIPGTTDVPMDFASLDVDGNGKGSRAEFRAYYRARGFRPVIAIVHPPSESVQRLSAALFAALDRDANGTLSTQELSAARDLLRRYDSNDDERLDPAEILELGAIDGKLQTQSGANVSSPSEHPDATLTIDLGAPSSVTFMSHSERLAAGSAKDPFHVNKPSGNFRVSVGTAGGDFTSAKAFYLAQFNEALSGRAAATLVELEADRALQALAAMFVPADQNGDGRLTPVELNRFLDLVGQGVSCLVVVGIEDRCGSLFDRFDTDGDEKLNVVELNRAAGWSPVSRSSLVGEYRLDIRRGPGGQSFGPVPIPSRSSVSARPPIATTGPAWFRALDWNGDGYVSAAEFRGPAARFAMFDRDADGRISPAEAESGSGSR